MNEETFFAFLESMDFTAVEHSPHQSAVKRHDLAQPNEYVSVYVTTLADELEQLDHYTLEELASGFNLPDVRPDDPFVQVDALNSGDSSNAPSRYLSDLSSEDDILDLVNEALDLDKVTHSSGLQPRYRLEKAAAE